MKKVIPKKKNPFYKIKDFLKEADRSNMSPYVVGVASENIKTGDLLVVNKEGRITRFTGSEGRKYV